MKPLHSPELDHDQQRREVPSSPPVEASRYAIPEMNEKNLKILFHGNLSVFWMENIIEN